jgi:putative transcriptional regulator
MRIDTHSARQTLPSAPIPGVARLQLTSQADSVRTRDLEKPPDPLGLTQEQFALRYGLDLDPVQNWEQGHTKPDEASSAYLRVIARRPDEAVAAQV